MTRPAALVFSDLDGTLLDHDSYSWAPAHAMLLRLNRVGVPVVLASSKTAVEMIPLRAAMALGPVPMICENGAGVVQADQTAAGSAPDYARLRDALNRLDPGLRAGFEGFGDMGPDRISQVTGLSRPDACRAASRSFSEPGLWSGSDQARAAFLDALQTQGISARMGGRFLTLSFGGTKADRMAEIADQYGNPQTIALGDAPNDLEMLQTADFGILIANPHNAPVPHMPGEDTGRIRRTQSAGPAGWTEGLTSLLSDLGIDDIKDFEDKEPHRG